MSNFTLTPEEQQALQEFAGLVAEESAVVMSTLLDKKIEIKVESAGEADADALGENFADEIVVVESQFASGFDATTYFLINKPLVAKLSDLMMMGEGDAEFNDDHVDAIQEGINQMMGATATSLTAKVGKSVDFQPSSARLATVAESEIDLEEMTASVLELDIEGNAEGKLALVIPYSVIQEAAASLGGAAQESEAPEVESAAGELDVDLSGLDAAGGDERDTATESAGASMAGGGAIAMPQMADIGDRERERLELLMDIKLDISIELGRTTMLVRDILELGPGSVVELDKMAGESVDLLIGNKKLAEGEVVVVEENFGVRVTHLISMEERIKMLQSS
ncbi:MAG: flagellar motor switch protein FliN [Candidatus Glassbacteria bacterium]|nr:flagellar motor switch protein FliN [Candidatus Glassbacteria bacterium]